VKENLARNYLVRCPSCGNETVRNVKTRGFLETLHALTGGYAFRCPDCGTRFIDWPMGVSSAIYAKCPRCFRMDLAIWDPKYYRSGKWTELKIWLGAHRWRCDVCRCNFTSWRPRREKYQRPEVTPPGSQRATNEAAN